MKKILLMAMTGLAIACGNNPSGNGSTDETGQDSPAVTQDSKIEVKSTSEPSIRETCTFSTRLRKNENDQCDALIITCKSCQKTQEFTCEFNWPKDEEYLSNTENIQEVDLNFDGTPDLLVYLGDFGVNPGLFPMEFYAAFIWEDDGFKEAKELDNVANLQVDAEKKVLTSEYTNPAGDAYHEVYAWKDGKFEMIEQTVHNEFDEEE